MFLIDYKSIFCRSHSRPLLKMGRYRVAQKLEARGFSETYAYFYQTVGRHMPEDSTVCNYCWQSIKFDKISLVLFGILSNVHMQILCDMGVDEIGAHVLPILAASFRFFSVTFP
jgi:hypothetical protein